jgi:hypothetical protein
VVFVLQAILPQQQLLEDENHSETILQYIPNEAVQAAVRERWASGKGSNGSGEDVNVQRWTMLQEEVQKESRVSSPTCLVNQELHVCVARDC